MISHDVQRILAELTQGPGAPGSALVLNSGDRGLLRTLHATSAADASRSVAGGATVAAHVEHLRTGFALMNQWATEGGDPFASAEWDAAWKISAVTESEWTTIRSRFQAEVGLLLS